MPLISTLLALVGVLGQGQPPAAQQTGETMVLAGRTVPLVFPKEAPRELPDEVLHWKGFAYLGDPRQSSPNLGFYVRQERLSLPPLYAAAKANLNATTPVWRAKFVIFTHVDILRHSPDGLLRQQRLLLDSNQVTATLAAIARFVALATAASDGRVRLEPDVTIEPETIRQEEPSTAASRAAFAAGYLSARVNGGKFDADDKVYRGPYNSIFLIGPLMAAPSEPTDPRPYDYAAVYGMPVSGVSAFPQPGDGTGSLEWALLDRLADHCITWARRLYIQPPELLPGTPGDAWSQITSFELPAASQLAQNAATAKSPVLRPNIPATIDPYYVSPGKVGIVDDPERGPVLAYTESGASRSGGVSLPTSPTWTGADLAQTPFLSFWAKSTSHDPIELQINAPALRPEFAEVVIGPDREQPFQSRSSHLHASFESDGKWHQVVVDLRSLGLKGTASSLAIGPSPTDVEKTQLTPIEYQFDKFEFLKEATPTPAVALTPDAASTNEIERAMAAAAMLKPDAPTSGIEKLLADPSEMVQLNAANVLTQRQVPAAVPALIDLSHAVNGRLASTALTALKKQGTPEALAEIRRLLTASPYDATREAVANLLSDSQDPNLAGPLSLMFGRKSWQAREAAARAISKLPGTEAPLVLMTFLEETDPQIRLTVTEGCNIAIPLVQKRVLWSAVNDPSDAVRAASCIKLLESNLPALTKEGAKGVRDDSVAVREAVLNFLRSRADEADRPTIRLGVTDSNPNVRAAALAAFAALPQPVTLDEIANVMDDRYPVVQLALIQLASKKSLTLPKATADAMKSSFDPDVAAKAKGIGGS